MDNPKYSMSKLGNAPILKLSLIILLYLVLAVSYSLVTPIGRGADEWAHYWYAQFIAQHRRLPLTPEERDLAGYKSDWPPLYHLAAAAFTGWIDTEGPPTFKYRADNIRRQLVPAQGPEAILHTEDELFPWRQEILVWHLGRFLSIGFSALALLVTYFVALEVFGGGAEEQRSRGAEGQSADSSLLHVSRFTHHAPYITPYAPRSTLHASRLTLHAARTLALAATAVLAFNPRYLFTGMLFNYDSLTLLLASLFLWLAIRVAKGYHGRWGFWALGALAGLALLTKYLTLLLPLVIVWVAGSREHRRRLRPEAQPEGGVEEQGGGQTKDEAAYGTRPTPHASRPTHHVSRSRQFRLRLAQAALAYLLVVSWWFGYLLTNFNEIDAYGPLLGALAPLIRGDSSDRTVEQIFAWLSGGQAPAPAYIEKQSYTAWQIITELPTTLWGNPIVRPYPLNWFIVAMTLVMTLALVGLFIQLRSTILRLRSGQVYDLRLDYSQFPIRNSPFTILVFVCLLPLPFMLIRLFGARDALEAVQGRHLLFLAGPAVAILLILGLSVGGHRVARWQVAVGRRTRCVFYGLLALLLAGALSQLLFMEQTYPSPLPVRTTALNLPLDPPPAAITLPGGAKLNHYSLLPAPQPYSLNVSLYWQAGDNPAPEDYQIELALVDGRGQTRSGWRGYQTQARYPTRAWEPGDIIRDDAWLPLAGLPPGEYDIKMRILGQATTAVPWQTLATYTLNLPPESSQVGSDWVIWRNGDIVRRLALLYERETVQLTVAAESISSPATSFQLVGPDGLIRTVVSAGPGWANFIVAPDWPAGDYFWLAGTEPILQVAQNERNFHLPNITYPLAANFEGKIKLLGYDLPSRRVEPGDGLPITLYWQGLEWLGEDFVIFDRLLDNPPDAGQPLVWGGYDRLPKENYSTLLWAPGEVVMDGFAVPVAVDAPAGVYTLSLGWYRKVDGQARSLPILDPETGEPTGATAVTIGPIKVGGPPPGVTTVKAEPEVMLETILGDQIKLLGFDLNSTLQTQNLTLVLYWQALKTINTDYTVFVHVRNAAGEVVAQKDSPPAGGAYPTRLWDAGEIIRDEVSVPLEHLAPGEYEVVVGMYDFITGLRLAVEGSPDEIIRLQEFEVGK